MAGARDAFLVGGFCSAIVLTAVLFGGRVTAGHDGRSSPGPRGPTQSLLPNKSISAKVPDIPSESPVETEMKNVDFRIDQSIVLRIRDLRGHLASTEKGKPPTFDDKRSFSVDISSAEIGINTTDLSDLMNRYVLAYPGCRLRKVKIAAKGDEVMQTGILRKAVDIPFEMEGTLEATPDGDIRLRTKSIKAEHLPVKGLLDALGLKMTKLVHPQPARGLATDNDDLILYPEEMIPAPRIQGFVRAVRIDGDQVIMTFGPAPTATARAEKRFSPPCRASSYMYFRGGTLRFGKLTMVDADLEIIDADPSDPFLFYLDRYNQQLVAGYSRSTPSFGLIVYMPPWNTVGKGSNGVTASIGNSRAASCR